MRNRLLAPDAYTPSRVRVAHHPHHARVHQRAPRPRVVAPAVERRVGEVHVRHAAAGGRRQARGIAGQSVAAEHRLEVERRRAARGHGAHVDHAAGRVAPHRRRVGPDHLHALGGGEVDLVERRAPVGLGFRKAVHEHAHAARRAGVGAVAGAAGAEAADHQPHVAGAVARLGHHARHHGERLVQPEAAQRAELERGDAGDGQRRGENQRGGAGGGDGHAAQGDGAVARAGILRQRRRGEQDAEHGDGNDTGTHEWDGWMLGDMPIRRRCGAVSEP